MPIGYPKTDGFLFSFTSLRVPDGAGGDDIGIRSLGVKNTKKGRSKVWGKSRRPLGHTAGADDLTFTCTWVRDYFMRWQQRNQPYTDKFFDLPIVHIEEGQKYEVLLKGCIYMDQDGTATEGAEGGIEDVVNFSVTDMDLVIDGVPIEWRKLEDGEG